MMTILQLQHKVESTCHKVLILGAIYDLKFYENNLKSLELEIPENQKRKVDLKDRQMDGIIDLSNIACSILP